MTPKIVRSGAQGGSGSRPNWFYVAFQSGVRPADPDDGNGVHVTPDETEDAKLRTTEHAQRRLRRQRGSDRELDICEQHAILGVRI